MSSPLAPPAAPFRVLAGLLAAIAGVIVFLNYFLPGTAITRLAQPLLQAVVLLTAAALVFAAGHLVVRHILRARRFPASIALVAGFVVTFVMGLLPAGFTAGAGRWAYQWLLGPGLAAVFALLPIFLAFALYRRLRIRDLGMALFTLSLIAVLLSQTPWLVDQAPWLAALRHNLMVGLAAAVFRGILIGLALAVVLAALARLFPRRGP